MVRRLRCDVRNIRRSELRGEAEDVVSGAASSVHQNRGQTRLGRRGAARADLPVLEGAHIPVLHSAGSARLGPHANWRLRNVMPSTAMDSGVASMSRQMAAAALSSPSAKPKLS